MKNVTVQEIRREFSRKVEGPLRRGEVLVVLHRGEIIARVIPEPAAGKPYPDFEARQKKIFGKGSPKLNVAGILSKDRNRL